MDKKSWDCFTIRVPKEMHKNLKEISFFGNKSMNDIMLEALENANLEERAKQARREYERSDSV